MTKYAQHMAATPQSEPADPRQVRNNAGGFTFTTSPNEALDRWLILGADGGTYYASERKVTRDNARTIEAMLDRDGPGTVKRIVEMSVSGRAPKNDPAIFALAMAAGHKDDATRAAALAAVPQVCRIGTHLFAFAEAVQVFRGWGRGLRRAIANWYNEKTPDALARQVVKYQQRNGWSHRDLLRLAHPYLRPEHAALARWIVAGSDGLGAREVGKERKRKYAAIAELPHHITMFEGMKHADRATAIHLIKSERFTHEAVPSEHLGHAEVWDALLDDMPPTAMIRNLARMTASGLIAPLSSGTRRATEYLADSERMRKARVHPIQLLSALNVYKAGHGVKGSLAWVPVPAVIDALDAAFYESFAAITPSGARTMLALDVSGSMGGGVIAGVPGLTPVIASACMAMVTARTEREWHIMAFDTTPHAVTITPTMRLDDVVAAVFKHGGGTDLSIPMNYAAREGIEADTIVIYTDNETWHGNIHPHEQLAAYRRAQVADAKLAVVAMTATEYTVLDPNDPRTMNLVGFDSSAPQVLAAFARKE